VGVHGPAGGFFQYQLLGRRAAGEQPLKWLAARFRVLYVVGMGRFVHFLQF